MSIITWGLGGPQSLVLCGYGPPVVTVLFRYYGERKVAEPMPEIEGWTPEEPYPASVIPEQFWTLHLKEAWKVAGDAASKFTWGPASESIAGICGVKQVVKYIEPPCGYEGEPDFYIRREHAPYVRYAMLAIMMERITWALYKLDKNEPQEALSIMKDAEDRLNAMSEDLKRPDVKIEWSLDLDTEERVYKVNVIVKPSS